MIEARISGIKVINIKETVSDLVMYGRVIWIEETVYSWQTAVSSTLAILVVATEISETC